MSDLPGPIVLDATVLYNLALTNELSLLGVFGNEVVTGRRSFVSYATASRRTVWST